VGDSVTVAVVPMGGMVRHVLPISSEV